MATDRVQSGSATFNAADDIWIKCPGCKEITFRKEVERNLNVCPKCEHHFRVTADQRLTITVDPRSWREMFADLAIGDPLEFVDTRPYPLLLERVNCQDMLHANFLISIGAELVVRDPRLAVSSSKAYIDDAMSVVRERLSLAGSRSIVDPSSEGRARMAAEISSELNRALETRGLEIRKLEITELWAQPLRQSIATGAN